MKKLRTLMLVGLMVLSTGATVLAGTSAGKNERFQLEGGFSHNTFDMTTVQDGTEQPLDENMDDLKQGQGFYGNGTFWVNNWFGLNLGYDQVASKAVNEEYASHTVDSQLSGWSVGMSTRLNDKVKFNLGVANYFYVKNSRLGALGWTEQYAGPGVLAGFQFALPINNSLSIHGNADMRLLGVSVLPQGSKNPEFDPENYVNLNGMRLGLGVSVGF